MRLPISGIVRLVAENPEEIDSNGSTAIVTMERRIKLVPPGQHLLMMLVEDIKQNENHRMRLIPLQGCSGSDAFQLLDNRWMAALNAYNNLPYDSPERPVMYTDALGAIYAPASGRGGFAVSPAPNPSLLFP
ncbi:hypothetical protein HAX54_014132 [Datura stramonium]|uniref:Uncharacterized protein n=1 Tax=Datura stramonium TaxID=4076 RepID=A0ABS8TPL9_DATST|nr:hypothetical protein [Datura stramonium]